MRKIIITVFILVFFSVFYQAQARDMKLINLDSANTVPAEQMDLSINNIPVNFSIIKEGDTLYIDSAFFLAHFKNDMDKIKSSLRNGGILKDEPEKLYVSLFKALSIVQVRYTYSSLYGKEIIRIRTDRAFTVDTTYIYNPQSSGTYGNMPSFQPGQLDANGCSTNGYPVVNSSLPVGGG